MNTTMRKSMGESGIAAVAILWLVFQSIRSIMFFGVFFLPFISDFIFNLFSTWDFSLAIDSFRNAGVSWTLIVIAFAGGLAEMLVAWLIARWAFGEHSLTKLAKQCAALKERKHA